MAYKEIAVLITRELDDYGNIANLTEKQKRAYEPISKKTIEIHPICDDIFAGYYKDGYLTTWFSKEEREKEREEQEKEELKKIKSCDHEYKTIVIVLESPHTKEYADTEFINPALGDTGKNLHNYFKNVFNSDAIAIDKQYNYRIILMNSIQFQCSLGLPTKYFRDHVWLNLWINEGFKEDFVERLKDCQPDIIFNFCTRGDHSGEYKLYPKDLDGCKTVINPKYIKYCSGNTDYANKTTIRELVSCAIQEFISTEISNNDNLKNIRFYAGPHPFSWKMIKKGKNSIEKNGKITIKNILTEEETTITLREKDDN